MELKNETVSFPVSKSIIPPALKDPHYLELFEFEKSFDFDKWRAWLGSYKYLSVYISLAYIFLIMGGRFLMAQRKPFSLTRPLFLWNFSLALFSIVGFFRVFPEVRYVLANHSFHSAICFR
jgi:elongation of very long chain fatty acids protein 6